MSGGVWCCLFLTFYCGKVHITFALVTDLFVHSLVVSNVVLFWVLGYCRPQSASILQNKLFTSYLASHSLPTLVAIILSACEFD